MKRCGSFHHYPAIVIYRGFASKLHHQVPHWVEPGAVFHIRVRLDLLENQTHLTDLKLGPLLLESARLYEERQRWHLIVLLLMPDHLHALLSFARDHSMSAVVGAWKHFHKRVNNVRWQEGYFDHRLRDDERGEQLSAKMDYIRRNPIVAGLCAKPEDWPWVIDYRDNIPPAWSAGGSAAPSGDGNPKAPQALNVSAESFRGN